MTQPAEDSNGADDPIPSLDDLADPLDRWARLLAVVLGIGAGAAGCVAVFLTENQAGTAVLLLVGAVLLLLGLQGTPLRSFGGGEYRFELARLRRRAAEVVSQAAREESADVAAAVADAISAIDPGIRFPDWLGMVYLDQARETIRALFPDARDLSGQRDGGADMHVRLPEGLVNVQVIYRKHGKLGSGSVTAAVAKMRTSRHDGGYLIVTNVAPTADAHMRVATLLGGSGRVEVVTWLDDRDTEELKAALQRCAR
ncbi:hypothetical protein ACFYPX_29175 [Micromonospora zamorensis]|uniref:hypothetical protein n=1 Tax=Micromonospora zamorensis TaxID=709883 RepID=UPI0036B1E8FB